MISDTNYIKLSQQQQNFLTNNQHQDQEEDDNSQSKLQQKELTIQEKQSQENQIFDDSTDGGSSNHSPLQPRKCDNIEPEIKLKRISFMQLIRMAAFYSDVGSSIGLLIQYSLNGDSMSAYLLIIGLILDRMFTIFTCLVRSIHLDLGYDMEKVYAKVYGQNTYQKYIDFQGIYAMFYMEPVALIRHERTGNEEITKIVENINKICGFGNLIFKESFIFALSLYHIFATGFYDLNWFENVNLLKSVVMMAYNGLVFKIFLRHMDLEHSLLGSYRYIEKKTRYILITIAAFVHNLLSIFGQSMIFGCLVQYSLSGGENKKFYGRYNLLIIGIGYTTFMIICHLLCKCFIEKKQKQKTFKSVWMFIYFCFLLILTGVVVEQQIFNPFGGIYIEDKVLSLYYLFIFPIARISLIAYSLIATHIIYDALFDHSKKFELENQTIILISVFFLLIQGSVLIIKLMTTIFKKKLNGKTYREIAHNKSDQCGCRNIL